MSNDANDVTVVDDTPYDPVETFLRAVYGDRFDPARSSRRVCNELLNELDEIPRRVVELYYGLRSDMRFTYDQIEQNLAAHMLKIPPRQSIRRIQMQAMRHLQDFVKKPHSSSRGRRPDY